MISFDLYQLAKRFKVPPKELRKIADRLEKELDEGVSKDDQIYQEYKEKLLKKKKK